MTDDEEQQLDELRSLRESDMAVLQYWVDRNVIQYKGTPAVERMGRDWVVSIGETTLFRVPSAFFSDGNYANAYHALVQHLQLHFPAYFSS